MALASACASLSRLAGSATPESVRRALCGQVSGGIARNKGVGGKRFLAFLDSASSFLVLSLPLLLMDAQLRDALTEEYQRFIQAASSGTETSASSSISQSGYVQLLVDLWLLQDVCAGGRSQALADASSTSEAGSQSFAAEEASAALAGLVSKVSSAIDPFDLDVYQPYLKQIRSTLYQRLSLLLGHFASLQPQHLQVSKVKKWGI